MHGHNWKVEVEVQANELDSAGMGVDFKVIKRHTRAITDGLDHRYLNEIEPFDKINPTAENIAAYIFEQVSDTLNTSTVKVIAVTLWETDRACVRYQE
jgi:6-pyruvoyltetrahydropterin/6-carboxytetrahydropterin synthase